MMFLRSVFAFQFLPPRQLLNLLSEAIPKASLEDISSPSPSHSADGSPSLETFLGATLRSGFNSPAMLGDHLLPPVPGRTQVHRLARAPARRHQHCPRKHPSQRGFGWSLQGCSQRAAGMWPPCFFRRRGFVPVGASTAVPVGRKIRGWMAACCGRWYRHSLGKRWLGAKELHCNSCLPTTFLLQRALNDGAEIVQ